MDKKVCIFFNTKAECRNDEKCQFKHIKIDQSQRTKCRYFTGPNGCFRRDACFYHHGSPNQSEVESLQTHDNIQEEILYNRSSHVSIAKEDSVDNEDDSNQILFECEDCSFKSKVQYRHQEEEIFEKHYKDKLLTLDDMHLQFLRQHSFFEMEATCTTCRKSGRKFRSSYHLLQHIAEQIIAGDKRHEHFLDTLLSEMWNKRVGLLTESEYIDNLLLYLTDSKRYEEQFPVLEADNNEKGKKMGNKQNALTSSSYENTNQDFPKFPEFFAGQTEELLNVMVDTYVSTFLLQDEKIECIKKELILTEENYCECLETVNEYIMRLPEDLKECATKLQIMFSFHSDLLDKIMHDSSDIDTFLLNIFEKENLTLYREYISNLPAYLKIFQHLHIENIQLDTKRKEFESDDTCMFRLETMFSMPQKRLTYYVNICKRINLICKQHGCETSHKIKSVVDVICSEIVKEKIECIKKELILTEENYRECLETVNETFNNCKDIDGLELKYTEYRWKGRQLKLLRHKYFQESMKAALQKKSTSEPIQKAKLGRELTSKIKDANIWAAERMLLSRCELLQTERKLNLHFLFEDEAIDVLDKILPAIENELKSRALPETIISNLKIITGIGNHSRDNKPVLITSVPNHLECRGYSVSDLEGEPGVFLIYLKV